MTVISAALIAQLDDKNLFDGINLTQLITEPTRVTEPSSSQLDLIFVSHPDRIIKSGVLSSDHPIIFCIWKINIPQLRPRYKHLQCKNMNIDHFIHDVTAIDWGRFQLIPYVEVAWNFLLSEFIEVIDKHALWKTMKVKGRHLPWISFFFFKCETKPGEKISTL